MSESEKNIKTIKLKHIKSKYILKEILNKIDFIKLLNIIRYNKKMQNKMNININTYREYSQIKLDIELFSQNRNVHNSFLLFDENKIFGNNEEEKKYSFIKIKEQFKAYFHFYFDNDKIEKKIYNLQFRL